MTKNFDTLVESILSEMMPATSEFGTGAEMGAAVAKKVEELPGKSQHWGPLQKLSPETRTEIIKAIIANVFTDNEDNTYSSIIDNPEQLKDAIKDAIKEVAATNPEFKASGKWAVQFLADRLSNKELLGNVKYTTAGGEEAVKKEVTQKEVKAALNKALQEAPAKEEAGSSEEVEGAEEAPQEKEVGVEVVYQKAADLESDDAELQKAFAKLPADKDLSWEQLLKTIGMTKAQGLLDAGGLSEITKEIEAEEPEFGEKHIDVGEEEDEFEPEDFDTSFRRSMSPFASSERYGEEY